MKNLPSLIRAFESLGWNVRTKSKCRTWSGNRDRTKVYDYVAVNPADGYDLGIVQGPKGLTLEGDTSMMREDVWDCLGKDFSKLKRQYSIGQAIQWADERQGQHTIVSDNESTGVVEMEIDIEISDFV